ncbi:MAG: DUF2497 domain-containing protein [Amphiplicatus sp.]
MTNPQPEPSMEEILASIRRIISEDEEGEAAPKVAAAKVPQPIAPPRPPQPSARPALILDPSGRDPEDDRAGSTLKTEDVEMFKKNTATAMEDTGEEEEALTTEVATAASKAFQTLSQSVRVSRGEGRTLEDMVTDMLRPMVKEWLDANLPQIVEEKVEEEVQRIARRRG